MLKRKEATEGLNNLFGAIFEAAKIDYKENPLQFFDGKRIFFGKTMYDDDYFIRVYDGETETEFAVYKTKGHQEEIGGNTYWCGDLIDDIKVASTKEGINDLWDSLHYIELTDKEWDELYER